MTVELQPKELTGKEKEFAEAAIENYKKVRDIMMFGNLYRITSPYEGKGLYALMHVSKDKKRAIAFNYCFEYQGRTHNSQSIKLNGLDPNKEYKMIELNVDKSNFEGNNKIFTGEYLINEGINPKLEKMYESAVFSIEAID